MKILGFNFTKISIEKILEITSDLKVDTNIDIVEIKPVNSDMFKTEEKFISVKFNYDINYDPDSVKINFSGNILFSLEKEKFEEILEEWKDKKMSDEFRLSLFNLILRRCSVKALELEDYLNLPYHMAMPTLKLPDSNKDNNKDKDNDKKSDQDKEDKK